MYGCGSSLKPKYRFKTRPFKHQRKATIRAVKKGNYAFFFEPRLGKSKSALDAAAIQALRGKVERVAIICPKIAIDVWREQIRLHLPDESRRQLRITIINYEKLRQRSREGGGKRKRWVYPRMKALEKWSPDLIILDESHRLKRAGGVTAQSIWRLVERLRKKNSTGLPWVYLLTGTPNPKGWIDLFAQFRILDSALLGTAKADFEDAHVEYGFGRKRFTIIKYRRVGKLKRVVRQNASTVTAEQAGLAGRLLWQKIRVSLPASAYSIYTEMAEEMIAEVGGHELTAKNAGVRRLRLLQITGGHAGPRGEEQQIHRAKLDPLADLFTDLREQGESVVLYARFLPEVHEIRDTAERSGYLARSIWGGTSDQDRRRYIREFQRASSKPGVLVLQSQAGSAAIELSRAAEVVFYSLPDSWELFKQNYDRVRGPNQKRPVRVTVLLARNTLDPSVLRGLQKKSDMHHDLMRSPRQYLFAV